MREFTLNIPHEYVRDVVCPCFCLIIATRVEGFQERQEGRELLYLGIIKSKQAVSTLDTRIKVERTALIQPAASQLAEAMESARFADLFSRRLVDDEPLSKLSPKLSAAVIDMQAHRRRQCRCEWRPVRALRKLSR